MINIVLYINKQYIILLLCLQKEHLTSSQLYLCLFISQEKLEVQILI